MREELKKLEGEPVIGRGFAKQIIPYSERSSSPKMLLLDVTIDGVNDTIDHIWITPKKNSDIKRRQIVYFAGTVNSYSSIDEKGNSVKKYGVSSPRITSTDKEKVRKKYKIMVRKKEKNLHNVR